MAMIIKECMDNCFYRHCDDKKQSLKLEEAAFDSANQIDPNSLMVEIEGIHAYPFATKNYTRYMPECLKRSVKSWTAPYRKPLIKHHNERDGEIIGRICAAEYVTDNTLSNTPALRFTVNVPDERAMKDVKSGLLATTSIGAIAHDVRCSICGEQLAAEGSMCDHERGYTYNGETCYWDIYDMEAKELSYVIVPSDMYSKNISVYPATKSSAVASVSESLECISPKGEQVMNLEEGKVAENTQVENTAEQVETVEAQAVEAAETATPVVAEEISVEEKETISSEEQIKTLKEMVATLEAEVKVFKEKVQELEATHEEDQKLLQACEESVAEAKADLKANMVEMMQVMRQALGKKAIATETLQERTIVSLRDSIADLKEDFDMKVTTIEVKEEEVLPEAGSVQDPTLQNNTEISISESSTKKETLDLRKEFESIFTDIVSTHK